ncbi:MAG: hypothetical protein ACREGC_02235 [Minisyncoccia bacterium]
MYYYEELDPVKKKAKLDKEKEEKEKNDKAELQSFLRDMSFGWKPELYIGYRVSSWGKKALESIFEAMDGRINQLTLEHQSDEFRMKDLLNHFWRLKGLRGIKMRSTQEKEIGLLLDAVVGDPDRALHFERLELQQISFWTSDGTEKLQRMLIPYLPRLPRLQKLWVNAFSSASKYRQIHLPFWAAMRQCLMLTNVVIDNAAIFTSDKGVPGSKKGWDDLILRELFMAKFLVPSFYFGYSAAEMAKYQHVYITPADAVALTREGIEVRSRRTPFFEKKYMQAVFAHFKQERRFCRTFRIWILHSLTVPNHPHFGEKS